MAITKIYTHIDKPGNYFSITRWKNGEPTDHRPAALVKRSDLVDEKQLLISQIASVTMTNAEKIAWCEVNHPNYLMRAEWQARLDEVNDDLSHMAV